MKHATQYLTKKAAFFLVWFYLIGYCAPASAQDKKSFVAVITNTENFERTNEVVCIRRVQLSKVGNSLNAVVKYKNQILITQLVDEDDDGRWDEILFQKNMKPHSSDTIQILWGEAAAFKAVTAVQLSLKTKTNEPSPNIKHEQRSRGFMQNIANPYYQMEGPGIENDKVAFRAFFDYRNGKDVYGKLVDTPILQQVGVGASWHSLQPWGMDVFKVGNSVGAGGLMIKENGRLYRLGDADTASFTALYEGAMEAAFSLQFKNWDVGTMRKNGDETVSLKKGAFFYKNVFDVPLTNKQNVAVGMANFVTGKAVYTKLNNRWSSISTYGKQAEGTATNLGVAILFTTDAYIENKTTSATDSIPNTSYVVLKPSLGFRTTIYFVAGWEKTDQRFATEDGFASYLQETANALAHPIKVTFINTKPVKISK